MFFSGDLGIYTGGQKVIKNIALSIFFFGGFGDLYMQSKGYQKHCFFYVLFGGVWEIIQAVKRS